MSFLCISGFFPTKKELSFVSKCQTIPLSLDKSSSLPFSISSLNQTTLRKLYHITLPSQKGKCWTERRYDKTIVLLIDALRFDFTLPSFFETSRNNPQIKYYTHKLKSLEHLLTNYPKHARLFRFISDPPTTTTQVNEKLKSHPLPRTQLFLLRASKTKQRLKGITTGGLPTFFDASSTFSSSFIQIDNLLSQLNKEKFKIHFMGDDTYME